MSRRGRSGQPILRRETGGHPENIPGHNGSEGRDIPYQGPHTAEKGAAPTRVRERHEPAREPDHGGRELGAVRADTTQDRAREQVDPSPASDSEQRQAVRKEQRGTGEPVQKALDFHERRVAEAQRTSRATVERAH